MVRYKTTAETQKKDLVAPSNCEIKASKWWLQLKVLMRKEPQKSPKKLLMLLVSCATQATNSHSISTRLCNVCIFDTIRQLGQNHQINELTHILFHMHVSPEYETYRMKIISKYIRQCVHTTTENCSKEDCVQFLR